MNIPLSNGLSKSCGAERNGNHHAPAATEKWCWSPAAAWRPESKGIQIGETLFGGIASALFPNLYFLTQRGATFDELQRAFPDVSSGELTAFLTRLVDERILVKGLLSPVEAFSNQKLLFTHSYGETLLYDPSAYEAYKKQQLNRPPSVETAASVTLQPGQWQPAKTLVNRRSHRRFQERPIPFTQFSQALSALRQTREAGKAQALYPSTGGLYGIDVYVHAKAGRIEQVPGGIYFYNPVANALHPVAPESVLTKEIHYHQNRPIFAASAFTLFFVFNAEVTMPVYGTSAYFLACVETGIILATFNGVAEALGFGLCPIGLVDFEKAGSAMNLKPNHILLHVAECGLKLDEIEENSGALAAKANGALVGMEGGQSGVTRIGDGCVGTADSSVRNAQHDGDEISVSELRRFLAASLPDYMVPSQFILIDEVPLTPNNKVDREALLKMEGKGTMGLGTQYIAAESDLEQELLVFWRKVISAEQIGVEDNFFDLGGDSMGVAEVHRHVLEKWRLDVPVVKMFQHPTIRSLARFLRQQMEAQPQGVAASAVPQDAARCTSSSCADEPAVTLSEMDRRALAWVRANPNDPRAEAVRAKLKSRGITV